MKSAGIFASVALGVLLACQDAPVSPDQLSHHFTSASVVGVGIPDNAVVQFGNPDVGSPFPPVPGHDASSHAKDKVRPRTVVIRAGGSVAFQVSTFHQVAIYDRGTHPDEIDVTATVDLTAPPPAPPGTVIIPDFLIDDPDDRLALSSFFFAPTTWTSPPGTFDQPGTYLVICSVVPHFVQANMYAMVIVN